MKKTLLYILFISCIFCNINCSKHATYTEENLLQSIKDVCQKEYKITDIKVSLTGKTLYIYMKLDNILLDSLELSEETSSKLEDILLTASRVSISTNANINFYKIVASDNKNPGIQFIITRYIKDIRRFMLGDISRGEYFKRLDMDIEFNPTILGSSTIKLFFKDLIAKDIVAIMKSYFPDNINLSNISPTIYTILSELSAKKDKKIEIIDIKSKRIDANKALIYCKTHETYSTGQPETTFLFPKDFQNEYMFLINIKKFPRIIEKILSFYTTDTENKLKYVGCPKEFSQYSDLSTWKTDLSGEIDISLNQFLSQQIAQRIRNEFKTNKKLSQFYTVKAVQADLYETDNKQIFDFKINIVKGSSQEALNLFDDYYLKVLEESIDIILFVLRRYEVNSFDYINITYIPKEINFKLTHETIKAYRKKKITIKNLIK